MEAESVLSEEELDALRDSSAEAAEDGGDAAADGCRLYDFRDPTRTLNGRLPGLDAVNEAFANGMQQVLRAMLGRQVEIDVGDTAMTRLADYRQSLPLPVSVHAAQVREREHGVYLISDGAFVFACVDAFFGGRGGAPRTEDGERELSSSERRLTALLAKHAYEELTNAWGPVCGLGFDELRVIKVAALGGSREDQIMVVSRFQVALNPGGGEFHVALPYALLDSLRGHLTAGPRSESSSRHWRRQFAERVSRIEVEARSVFQGARLTFGELMALRPGDFIPLASQNRVVVTLGEMPLYVAEPGTSNGLAAAKILARADRTD